MLTLVYLLLVMIFIVVSTTKLDLHPFLALLISALVMGFLSGIAPAEILESLSTGFGGTLKSIGIVIACGTIIGTFLERSGGASTMASSMLRLVGEKRAPLAMSITGFIVSIPVFCDSGFVILSTLNRAISKRTGISLAVLATALATGLYTTHVFVPPTPGPLAAAATLGADVGLVLILGLIVSIPVAAAGLVWALVYAKRFSIQPTDYVQSASRQESPALGISLLPLLLPILLIAQRSLLPLSADPGNFIRISLDFIGNPVTALLIGVFTAFALKTRHMQGSLFDWVGDGLKSAGSIILITGAGGAFGAILRATDLGATLGSTFGDWQLGIVLPFVIAAVLKTAQGSSTVAIITTAALISPMLGSLGLATAAGKALAVLAIGAGAMTVSHANDSYFWVVSQFSDMDTATALRAHTLATLFQGLTGIVFIAILHWLLI